MKKSTLIKATLAATTLALTLGSLSAYASSNADKPQSSHKQTVSYSNQNSQGDDQQNQYQTNSDHATDQAKTVAYSNADNNSNDKNQTYANDSNDGATQQAN
ncbi:hypothetical protein [Piscirickettsia litoralis]|uniref:Uncharacterized protein n=1 Tax=Piscirickettsia litoralis TaxID=1891921 RepID=A0ABX3ABC8_9GAMM|nr:hypothetical protein [Piscirickettsia litoralis]ODN43439.1 hypothetical protein BGC07_11560 [Piscirickettsia litoralis]